MKLHFYLPNMTSFGRSSDSRPSLRHLAPAFIMNNARDSKQHAHSARAKCHARRETKLLNVVTMKVVLTIRELRNHVGSRQYNKQANLNIFECPMPPSPLIECCNHRSVVSLYIRKMITITSSIKLFLRFCLLFTIQLHVPTTMHHFQAVSFTQ